MDCTTDAYKAIICIACVNSCHKGHRVTQERYIEGYCLCYHLHPDQNEIPSKSKLEESSKLLAIDTEEGSMKMDATQSVVEFDMTSGKSIVRSKITMNLRYR